MAVHTFVIGNITVTIDIPAFEESILEDQVVSAADWVKGYSNFISNKINLHKDAIVTAEIEEARRTGALSALQSTDEAIVQARFAKPGYKNRAVREAEVQAAEVQAAADRKAAAEALIQP